MGKNLRTLQAINTIEPSQYGLTDGYNRLDKKIVDIRIQQRIAETTNYRIADKLMKSQEEILWESLLSNETRLFDSFYLRIP